MLPAVAAAPALRSFTFTPLLTDELHEDPIERNSEYLPNPGPHDDTVLPTGPWLSRLHTLVAPACVLANSAAALSSAQSLERMACIETQWQHLTRICTSAERLPSLPWLLIPHFLLGADDCWRLLKAQRRCPRLLIELTGAWPTSDRNPVRPPEWGAPEW